MPYYPQGTDLTAIDISEKMLARADRRAKRLGIDVKLQVADAQELPYTDTAFELQLGRIDMNETSARFNCCSFDERAIDDAAAHFGADANLGALYMTVAVKKLFGQRCWTEQKEEDKRPPGQGG